ncbi:MAG: pseudouridine synthase [Verrucomicrobiae bacterium]|nr:pseudouridine synthase [Verrucomicrobiae bacterium]NNJ42812.1 rRNA pseudouridine synthase [Akkermansiaceae bacterium]
MSTGSQQGTRLNKYLASCGVGSRRACDALIQEGGVFINNSSCSNPATRVDADDIVRVGRKVVRPKTTETILLNKPPGLVCSSSDELGRETIYHILPPHLRHLKNVGRLDKESEGLLVLTNDGDLALKLTHPRQKVEKEYLVTVNQAFSNEVIDKLISGVYTPEGRASAKSMRRISPRRVSVVLETGLKRQIRYMFEAVHLKVTKLVRTRIGLLQGGGLELGSWRALEEDEITALQLNPKPRRPAADVMRATKSGSSAKKSARKSTTRKSTGRPAKKSARRPTGKKVFRRKKK